MFIVTALFGRLFLCPRIAMHNPKPPPLYTLLDKITYNKTETMYYHTCPCCGANLDPKELCDCFSHIRGKAPISITKRHFSDMCHLGDIIQIDGSKIPPVDIITFGSLCQNLSTIGNRAG